jgi:hypothetical protein
MASFSIQVTEDPAFSRIMESVISRGVTHNKETRGGTVTFEIQGTVDDYRHFESLISDINTNRGYSIASIYEMI